MKPRLMLYNGAIAAFGLMCMAYSLIAVVRDHVSYQWLILAYLTVLTGAFTVRIPRVNSKFSVSDTFTFINMILFGTAAGVLTAALDGLVGSIRCRTTAQRKTRVPFNSATLAISVFAAGQVFYQAFGRAPLSDGHPVTLSQLGVPVIVAAIAYYLCNSAIVAWMVALESGNSAVQVWRRGLLMTFGITLAGASVGALLAFTVRSVTPVTLLIVVPVLVVIYSANMIYMRPEVAGQAADPRAPSVADRPGYRRFHYFMVMLGIGFVALLAENILQAKLASSWMIVAALAVLAGFVTVKIPGIPIKFSLADTFIFANTILFGPLAGGITAALDGLGGSMRCRSKARRWEFTFFNVGGMCLSAFIAGELFSRMVGYDPARGMSIDATKMFLPALVLGISYYLLNTMAVAAIVALQAHQNVIRLWRENMGWGFANCIACAMGAVFVAAGLGSLTTGTALGVAAILLVSYVMLKSAVDALSRRASYSA